MPRLVASVEARERAHVEDGLQLSGERGVVTVRAEVDAGLTARRAGAMSSDRLAHDMLVSALMYSMSSYERAARRTDSRDATRCIELSVASAPARQGASRQAREGRVGVSAASSSPTGKGSLLVDALLTRGGGVGDLRVARRESTLESSSSASNVNKPHSRLPSAVGEEIGVAGTAAAGWLILCPT